MRSERIGKLVLITIIVAINVILLSMAFYSVSKSVYRQMTTDNVEPRNEVYEENYDEIY